MAVVTSERIVVPVGPFATDHARADVARWSQLFPDDALSLRMSVLTPVLRLHGVDLEDRRLAAVRGSLSLGTTAEVGLRLIGTEAPQEAIEHMDAVTALMRVTLGVITRRATGSRAIDEQLDQAVRALLHADDRLTALSTQWEAMAAFIQSERPVPWPGTALRQVAEAQPHHLAVLGLKLLYPALDGVYVDMARAYGATYWLATDLLTFASDSTPAVGPVGDSVHRSAGTSEITAAVNESVGALNHYASALQTTSLQLPPSASPDLLGYATTTIRFAGEVYARTAATTTI